MRRFPVSTSSRRPTALKERCRNWSCIKAFSEVDTLAGERSPHLNLGLLTFCVLVLRNGFTVTGESACASPENFDPQIGRDIAFKNAREKIWPLEGYLLKQRLSA